MEKKYSTLGKKFLQLSGRIKPVINLNTQKKFESILQASQEESLSRTIITIACETGKKLKNGTRYSYLNLEGEPILTEGHYKDHFIGKIVKKIKEKPKPNNCIKYISWPAHLTHEEAHEQKQIIYYITLSELYNSLKIKNKSHIKAVCEGTRSNVDSHRIAQYDAEKNCPILHKIHNQPCKKIMRKVECLNDNKKFDNCAKAGSEYSIDSNQVALCAKGILKSVYAINKETNKKERLRFVFLDRSNKPILTSTHQEPLEQRKGISRIFLAYEHPEIIEKIGTNQFSSLAEYSRKTGVPIKRARKYLKDKSVNLFGLEFITID